MPDIRFLTQQDGTPTAQNPIGIVAAVIATPAVSGLLTQPGNAVGDALATKAAKGANADITSLSGTAAAPGIDFLASSTTVASAATVDLGALTTIKVQLTGSATITSFGTQPHRIRLLHFTGTCTLVHNATSLILPGAASIVTAAGDAAVATSDASGNWRVRDYARASGKPIVGPVAAEITDASTSGRSVLTGTPAQGASALALGASDSPAFSSLSLSGAIGIGGIVPLDTAHVEGALRLSDAARGGSTRFLYPTADDGSLLSGGRSAELTLRNNLGGLNVIALQNMNPAGFSAAVFRDQYGVEHGAVGWGNDGTGAPFVGTAYFEASVYTGASHTTPPPPFIIVTTGFMKAPDAPGAYGTYERVRVRPDGFFSLKNLRFGSNDFNYDQYNARLGLRVQTPVVDLQVNGVGCFADTEAIYAPDATQGYQLNIINTSGKTVRFIKANVGKVDWQFNGSAGGTDRRMSIIDTDSGGIEVLSVMANGSGSVGIKKAAPATGVTLDVGGPIRAGTYTVGTVPAGVVGAQIYVSNARKVGEAAGSGTGVLAYYSNGAWRRLSDDTTVAA